MQLVVQLTKLAAGVNAFSTPTFGPAFSGPPFSVPPFCHLDVSPPRRFSYWKFCTLDVSPTHWTFRCHKWTFRHSPPVSLRGRNINSSIDFLALATGVVPHALTKLHIEFYVAYLCTNVVVSVNGEQYIKHYCVNYVSLTSG